MRRLPGAHPDPGQGRRDPGRHRDRNNRRGRRSALREKLVDRATPTQQTITADTTITKPAAVWLKYLRDEERIEGLGFRTQNRL